VDRRYVEDDTAFASAVCGVAAAAAAAGVVCAGEHFGLGDARVVVVLRFCPGEIWRL
jgi:hypothetical protein